MKLDLILENVRNSYTLNLLEESTAQGIGEKEVLMGKMLINESTMMVRRILVEEGVMEDVKLVLENTFAQIIEEFSFDSDEVLDGASRVGKAIVNVPVGFADGVAGTAGSVARQVADGNYGGAALTAGAAPIMGTVGAAYGAADGYNNNRLMPNPVEAAQDGYDKPAAGLMQALGATGAAGGAAGYLLGRRGIRR